MTNKRTEGSMERPGHINEAWSNLLLERLHAHGLRDLCIAPGSRSAPLALAAARLEKAGHGLRLHTHFDERGLGFYALGIAKASGNPTAVITTSGSAVANLHPSMVEAFQIHAPLIALTADRPPELIACGVNQAIEQRGLFQPHVRAEADLPAASTEVSAVVLCDLIDEACRHLRGSGAGPIHINAPFREPLYGGSSGTDLDDWLGQIPVLPGRSAASVPEPLPIGPGPTLLVAGQLDARDAKAVLTLAERCGLPLIADIGSQLRLQVHPCLIPYPELWLQHPRGRAVLDDMPQIIQFGGRLVNKRLNQWLSTRAESRLLLTPYDQSLDPDRRVRQFCVDIPLICQSLELPAQRPLDTGAWSSVLEPRLDALEREPFSELLAARILSQELPADMTLMAGNSLSVRLLDMLACPSHGQRCLTQRGASGIDGLVASAAGAAACLPGGLSLLLGDLSLLHDLNSLALAARARNPLVIVVLNNDGGGIFSLLPARQQADAFDPLFRMPHGLSFGHAAAQFGIEYHCAQDAGHFRSSFVQACSRRGASLIELRFAPMQTAEALARLLEDVASLQLDSVTP